MFHQHNTNMANIQIFVVFSALIVLSQAISKKEAHEGLEGFGQSCTPLPTEVDYEALLTNDMNPPKTAKCFRNCLLQQISLVQDGKVDTDTAKQFFGMVYKDEEELGGQIAAACNAKVTETDECEAAHGYFVCFMEQMKAHNKEIPKLD